jgi:hypothetical protein
LSCPTRLCRRGRPVRSLLRADTARLTRRRVASRLLHVRNDWRRLRMAAVRRAVRDGQVRVCACPAEP